MWKQRFHGLAEQDKPFRLEVIVRKEMIKESLGCPFAALHPSLQPQPGLSTTKAYRHAVELVREAIQEAMAKRPLLKRVVVRFQWTGR